MSEILKEAAEIVGGFKRLAALLGIRHNSMYSWRQIPPARVLDIERLTGISRHRQRPDVFGDCSEHDHPSPVFAGKQCGEDEAICVRRHVNASPSALPSGGRH
ncbi:transcriptional regulator [Aureimonas sp. AU40]|uniref:transcriptional regulator n=1 Tax=Aureimonas sp. AU40 TaxID=1637747 RepID=UPI0009EAD40C|nr:YdaS family helix-turn-helix protein [Aureimonas sp. AU40]